MDDVLKTARARKAEEFAQEYLQRKPGAIKLIDKLLAGAGSSIDALIVQALPMELDKIERIDRLITVAETRRNAMLREIDRRRAVLGEALRRQVQADAGRGDGISVFEAAGAIQIRSDPRGQGSAVASA